MQEALRKALVKNIVVIRQGLDALASDRHPSEVLIAGLKLRGHDPLVASHAGNSRTRIGSRDGGGIATHLRGVSALGHEDGLDLAIRTLGASNIAKFLTIADLGDIADSSDRNAIDPYVFIVE